MNSSHTSVLVESLYKPIRIIAIILLSVLFIQAYMMYTYASKVKNPKTSKELINLSYASLIVVIGMTYLMYEG